jgi:hypothetical protein
VVEFRGALRADDDGSVIEGSVGYNLSTRLQFVGSLAFIEDELARSVAD